jgi:ABC-type enterochelin transport system ATPase subunit
LLLFYKILTEIEKQAAFEKKHALELIEVVRKLKEEATFQIVVVIIECNKCVCMFAAEIILSCGKNSKITCTTTDKSGIIGFSVRISIVKILFGFKYIHIFLSLLQFHTSVFLGE